MFDAVLFWQGNSIFRKTFEFYLSVWPQFIGKCKNSKLQNFLCISAFCVPLDRDRDRSLRDERDRDKISRDCPAWMSRGTIGTGIENVGLSRLVSCLFLDVTFSTFNSSGNLAKSWKFDSWLLAKFSWSYEFWVTRRGFPKFPELIWRVSLKYESSWDVGKGTKCSHNVANLNTKFKTSSSNHQDGYPNLR